VVGCFSVGTLPKDSTDLTGKLASLREERKHNTENLSAVVGCWVAAFPGGANTKYWNDIVWNG
jgi:hypothetical protein